MKIYENGTIREMSNDELKEHQKYVDEIAETTEQPTEFDKLEAQVAYTALMTDTLLIEEV